MVNPINYDVKALTKELFHTQPQPISFRTITHFTEGNSRGLTLEDSFRVYTNDTLRDDALSFGDVFYYEKVFLDTSLEAKNTEPDGLHHY